MARLVADAFVLQEDPQIVACKLPGPWLLQHSTPAWRIEDPEQGFQRMVNQDRARQIAVAVLDQGRTFPNAIVLATNMAKLGFPEQCRITLPANARFLVVDGQHRLWAQHFSENEAEYACLLHLGLTEVEMARLFLEINDTQKRVPSSLRWDLVRLVRPDDNPLAIETSEVCYALATDESSPFFQRIDLTGEQKAIRLKQGSVAPAVNSFLRARKDHDDTFEDHYAVIVSYFTAVRELDPQGWRAGSTPLYQARTVRALFRLLADILAELDHPPRDVAPGDFQPYLERIELDQLTNEALRATQGSAGIKAIYDQLHAQVLGIQ